jgi:hypothetical protein
LLLLLRCCAAGWCRWRGPVQQLCRATLLLLLWCCGAGWCSCSCCSSCCWLCRVLQLGLLRILLTRCSGAAAGSPHVLRSPCWPRPSGQLLRHPRAAVALLSPCLLLHWHLFYGGHSAMLHCSEPLIRARAVQDSSACGGGPLVLLLHGCSWHRLLPDWMQGCCCCC